MTHTFRPNGADSFLLCTTTGEFTIWLERFTRDEAIYRLRMWGSGEDTLLTFRRDEWQLSQQRAEYSALVGTEGYFGLVRLSYALIATLRRSHEEYPSVMFSYLGQWLTLVSASADAFEIDGPEGRRAVTKEEADRFFAGRYKELPTTEDAYLYMLGAVIWEARHCPEEPAHSAA